jgi:hypothetical protein
VILTQPAAAWLDTRRMLTHPDPLLVFFPRLADPLLFALFVHELAAFYGFTSDIEEQLEDWPAEYRPHAQA